MTHDDAIDRALRGEAEISPSLGFSSRVMRSVRHEAAHRQAIPFPWKPLTAGLAVMAALILAGALGGSPPEPALAAPSEHMASAIAWLTTILAGVLAAVWWCLRFAVR